MTQQPNSAIVCPSHIRTPVRPRRYLHVVDCGRRRLQLHACIYLFVYNYSGAAAGTLLPSPPLLGRRSSIYVSVLLRQNSCLSRARCATTCKQCTYNSISYFGPWDMVLSWLCLIIRLVASSAATSLSLSLSLLLFFCSRRGASGVSTGTLLSLACASGIFAIGVGFVAGYKASPSFAYMRIPSLS